MLYIYIFFVKRKKIYTLDSWDPKVKTSFLAKTSGIKKSKLTLMLPPSTEAIKRKTNRSSRK